MNTIKKNGFTLIEMLVSIMIIAVVSGIVMVNYGQGSKQNALARSAQKLVLDLRRAQNMATSTVAVNGQIANYYGLFFRLTPAARELNYLLYYEDGGNGCSGCGGSSPIIGGEILEIIRLESGIKIQSIDAPGNKINIAFSSPFGEISFIDDDGVAISPSFVTITLSFLDGSKTKNVIIYPSGQIEIQ